MPGSDIHLDAMLRHLGAAYYESLHGRATRADVARALGNVEEQLNEQAAGRPARVLRPVPEQRAGGERAVRQFRGWARKVGDVMATDVVTIDRATPYKEIAALLATHHVSGVPVLTMGCHVAGVVTEADLLAAQRKTARRVRVAARGAPWWQSLPGGSRHPALTAGELMSSPAITISPEATVAAAATCMSDRHVGRLPVIDDDGKLIGLVSRRDLLTVFLRPDKQVAADVRRVLDDILLSGASFNPGEVDVTVRDGIVTLTGRYGRRSGSHAYLLPLAIRLMWDVDGVIDIIDELGRAAPGEDRTATAGGGGADAARPIP